MNGKSYYFGIDVGGTFTKAALVDGNGRLVIKEKVSSEGFSDKAVFLRRLRRLFAALLARKDLRADTVRAIGIGVPGPVDADRGLVLTLTNIKGWKDFYLARYLSRAFGVPVFVENDANCMALAEVRLGAARGLSYALCLTLGTGVGGGLILGGEIYRGPFFSGGEVGHIPISSQGPPCECGGKGCLEQYVGNRALLARARRDFLRPVTLERLSVLAERGDRRARIIWRDTGAMIGLAVSGIVNVFNPQVVVVGGGVASAGPVLLRSIRRTIDRHGMRLLKGKVKVKKALLGHDAGVLGAAQLAKEKVETDA